jgi:TPR repeat protein
MHGNGIDKDAKLAFEWMLRSAQLNLLTAVCWIGRYYRHGFGTFVDHGRAMEWFKSLRWRRS